MLGWGLTVTGGALLVPLLGRKNSILQLLNLLMYPFSGVLLGVFLLGLLTRRACPGGVLMGAAGGFFGAIARAALTPMSSFYSVSLGSLLTIWLGYAASWMFAAPHPEQLAGLSRRAQP